MGNVITDIRRELKQSIDEKTQKNSQYFFKEKVRFYGVKTAIVIKISKEYFKSIKDRPKAEIFALCDKLWQSGYIEESFVACKWSYFVRKDYEPGDFKVFEKWVKNYVNNWASCDTLCNQTVGEFLEMYPEYLPELRKWARSKNRWMRRATTDAPPRRRARS